MFKKLILIFFFCSTFLNLSHANFDIKARSAILQDFFSGEILYEKDADLSIYPASMTKIMTSIIAFDLLKTGDLNLDDEFLESIKEINHLEFLFWNKIKLLSFINSKLKKVRFYLKKIVKKLNNLL